MHEDLTVRDVYRKPILAYFKLALFKIKMTPELRKHPSNQCQDSIYLQRLLPSTEKHLKTSVVEAAMLIYKIPKTKVRSATSIS